jgi:PhnB protein
MSPQTTTTVGVPARFTTVTPYLAVVDVERLIAFAKEAFGAVEAYRTTGSAGGAFCIMRIGDSMLMCTGGPPVKDRPKLNALHIFVPDTDAVYQRAIEAGGESLYPPADKPYGERGAGVKDPTGNLWFIATRQAGPRLEGVRTVTPYLLAENASGLVEFLKQAFSARQEGVAHKSPDGKLMHAMLWIGDAALEFGESQGLPFAFYLYVPDADALYRQAVAAGAKPLYPPKDQPYGDRMGGVEDAWGNTWYIATHSGAGF